MEALSNKQKDAIREALRAYVAKYPSQNKAAGSLKNTSVGTISCIVNGKYENISDKMFRDIAAQIGGGKNETGWQIVETSAYQEINFALDDAQRWRNVTWVGRLGGPQWCSCAPPRTGSRWTASWPGPGSG